MTTSRSTRSTRPALAAGRWPAPLLLRRRRPAAQQPPAQKPQYGGELNIGNVYVTRVADVLPTPATGPGSTARTPAWPTSSCSPPT